jgi:hypothetical protein
MKEQAKEEQRSYIGDDVEINENNFTDYFFDIKNHKPQRGQIMARYSSMAELIKGEEKKYLIKLLTEKDKAISASQFMKKALLATEKESVRIPMKIANDLLSGMDEKKVLNKVYRFQMEVFFYTWPECVPSNDIHWECVSLKNLDKFLEQAVEQAFKESEDASHEKSE